MVVGRLLSYWEGNFSGAMLNFRGVTPVKPIYKAIYGGYSPIYKWWRGQPCRCGNQTNAIYKPENPAQVCHNPSSN